MKGPTAVVIHRERVFCAQADTLWFSEQGSGVKWPERNYIVFEGLISGLESTPDGLLVRFADHDLRLLTGDNEYEFTVWGCKRDPGEWCALYGHSWYVPDAEDARACTQCGKRQTGVEQRREGAA